MVISSIKRIGPGGWLILACVVLTVASGFVENKNSSGAGSPSAPPSLNPHRMELSVFGGREDNRLIPDRGVPEPLRPLFDAIIEAEVTAYCPGECCCDQFADGITASGHVIQPGDKFVAAPPEYPFGTMIDIPDYGLVPVLDRGGAIKGNQFDVYFPDHNMALRWGRQYLTVTMKGMTWPQSK